VNRATRPSANGGPEAGKFGLSLGNAWNNLPLMGNTMRVAIFFLPFIAGIIYAQEPVKPKVTPDKKADLSVLDAVFKANMDDVSTDYKKWLADLQKWYLAGLDKLQGERMKAGDLEGTLAFKAERDRIAGHVETTPEQIQAMPELLGKLRAVYEPALKKITDEAARRKDATRRKHLANLDTLQKHLTISGDLDGALLVKKEKDALTTEIAETAGVTLVKEPEPPQTKLTGPPPKTTPAPFLPSEPLKTGHNLLAGEELKKWTIEKGDWKTESNVLTGSGDSSTVFRGTFYPPFTLEVKIKVLQGTRPRIRFGPFEFANEGYKSTFGLYPNPAGALFPYEHKTDYNVAIAVSRKSVDLKIDGKLIMSQPGVKEKIERLDFSAGDDWSKGQVEFRDITILK
jgi:hypothetical protein